MGFEHRYPIYVPSKGRAEYQYTIPLLIEMRAAFFVIVEEQEYAAYARRVPKDRLLVTANKHTQPTP